MTVYQNTVFPMNDIQRGVHELLYGRFNDFPPNWREVSESELLDSPAYRRATTCSGKQEFRQMIRDRNAPSYSFLSANLIIVDEVIGGYCIYGDAKEKRMRYFLFDSKEHLNDMVGFWIDNDGGWHEYGDYRERTNCYHRFSRAIKLNKELSDQEYALLQRWAQIDNPSYGQQSVRISANGPGVTELRLSVELDTSG